MALICPECKEFAGPLTQELHAESSLVGTGCVCGGKFEEIDDDILKALLPFAPKKEGLPTWAILGGAVLLSVLYGVKK